MPMQPSRLVSLSIRVALIKDHSENIPRQLSIARIRSLAKGDLGDDSETKYSIRNFITEKLPKLCKMIDEWLLFDGDFGILSFHRTSIARSSPDIYLLLLHFADRLINCDTQKKMVLKKTFVAMSTIIHWFGLNKQKIIDLIFIACKDEISEENIKKALLESIKEDILIKIHSPNSLNRFMSIPQNPELLKNWYWYKLVCNDDGSEKENLRIKWLDFINTIKGNREMLLYAQRRYINSRFSDYDPSRKDLWEDHNRPWDFDHLLAAKYLYNKKSGEYRQVCYEQWLNVIGNLRAWPLEDNRSDQYDLARDKITNDEIAKNSFINDDEIEGFSVGDEARFSFENANLFIDSTKKRFLRIYQTWYENLEINKLISDKN